MKLNNLINKEVCSNNNVITPDKDGNVVANNKKLTSLKGLPDRSENFNCSYNNLTSLKGAPQEVKYNLIINDNKLSKQEIVSYLKNAKIGEEIETDYGNFDSQVEAIEKLTETIKESYFNY